MKASAFEQLMEEVFVKVRKMNATKGKDYATDADALAHLHEQASEFDIAPELVWGILARKHWQAITSYVKEGQVHSEPIESRVLDLMLYSIMLLALSRDETSTE